MPVERHAISRSQLCDLLAVDPEQFIGIERTLQGWCVVTEGEAMHTTGTFPQTSDNTRRKPKKGKK